MSFAAPSGLSGIGKPVALRPYGGTRRPGWVLPGAVADFDLAKVRAFLNGGAYMSEAAIKALFSTWSTPGHYATGKDGVLYWVPANRMDGFVLPVGQSRGQLSEEARTNLFLNSADLTQASWNAKTQTTITLNAGTAPDGMNTAIRLQGTGSGWYLAQQQSLTAATYANSWWVKSNTGSNQSFQLFGEGTISSGNLIATTSWQRFAFPYTATATSQPAGIAQDTSNNTADLLVWCPQLELGAFATSPIPTVGAAATRAVSSLIAADGLPLATAGQQAKAAYFETYGVAGGGGPRLLNFDGGGSAMLYLDAGRVRIFNGVNTADATIGASGAWAGLVKSAFGMDATSFTAIANGGTQAMDLQPWGGNTGNVNFGNRAAGDRALNGYLSRFAFGDAKGQFDGLAA